MKSVVYSKAGQVGLVEVERPQIKEADDVYYPYRENLCLWYGLMDIS